MRIEPSDMSLVTVFPGMQSKPQICLKSTVLPAVCFPYPEEGEAPLQKAIGRNMVQRRQACKGLKI